jgi:hypothetical protein
VAWLLWPKQRQAGCAILGSLMGMGGAIDSARQRRDELRRIADTPGLNVGQIGSEAVGVGNQLIPQVGDLMGRINQAGMGAADAVIPGYSDQVSKRAGVIDDWLGGNVPQDVLNQLQNTSAARSFSGGYSGSGLHQNREARDFGMTSLDLIMRGMGAADQFNQNTMNIVNPGRISAGDYMTSGDELTNIRGGEREQRIATLIGAANAPTDKEVKLRTIQNIEQQVMELIGAAAGAVGCWVAREVYGTEDLRWLLFRHWLFNIGPAWLKNLYMRHGERFAKWIADKPRIKSVIRRLMDKAIGGLC